MFEFLRTHDPASATASAAAIASAVSMLSEHPFAGRRIKGELRELVVSFGRTGYVALYRYLPARGDIRVLALKHQRELDYLA